MEKPKFNHGTINWRDISVPDAKDLKDFYQKITNWNIDEIPMKDDDGDYADYLMKSEDGIPVAGICNQRGTNQDIPSGWIMYISVENVQEAVEKAVDLGAEIIKKQIHKDGSTYYAILKDPSGNLFGLAKTQF
ncbi:MAG TPA: VOC family protein [Flavobacterium sp.]|nr:VOC family protein [Flavobacterium sp.]